MRGSTSIYVISDKSVPITVSMAMNMLYPITNGISPSCNAPYAI